MTTDPVSAAKEVVRKITAAPHLGVSAEDADILLVAPQRTLMMDKLLAIHFNQTRDFPRALDHAQAVFAHEPTGEGAKNIALLLRRCRRFHEGIAFAQENEALFDPVDWNDTLCMLHWSNDDLAGAIEHGDRSLALKDAASPEAPALAPAVRRFDREQPQRNVIVFSLFGADPRYLAGAQHNAVVARYLYPGWSVRFYVDHSIPDQAAQALIQQGAQVLRVSDQWPAAQYGLFWRFLVEDDGDVDIYIVRDADSVMNIKERAAVEDWLASGKAFHVMRDFPSHSELILAGMWGAHRGNLGDMTGRVRDHVEAAQKKLNNRITDQEFLRREIWPVVRQDALVHDSHFTFGGAVPFRDEFRLPKNRHIGQNDWVHRRSVAPKR